MIGFEMKMPSNCGECPLLEKSNNPRYPFVICKASVPRKETSIFDVAAGVPINCPLIPAVSLERIKEARETMEGYRKTYKSKNNGHLAMVIGYCISLIDKLIAENEGEQ